MKLPTPLEPAPAGLAPRSAVYLKREDVHELGAFKWRGALPTLEQYRRDGAGLVVTASTGNHGSATAWAAQRLGLRAVVYAPEDVSRTKLDLMRDARSRGQALGRRRRRREGRSSGLGGGTRRAVLRGRCRARAAGRLCSDRHGGARAASRTACCRRRSGRQWRTPRRDRARARRARALDAARRRRGARGPGDGRELARRAPGYK